MDPRNLSPMEQGECIQDLARSLVSAVPEGWQQLTYLARPIGALDDGMLAVQGADGQVRQIQVPDDVPGKVDVLKQAGFQEGKGTWLSMLVSVHHSGQMNVEYNHDTQPEISPEPNPLVYLQEMRRFPRADDQIPDWMRSRLHQAQQMDEGRMAADFGAALVEACAREGLHAEYLRPTGLRVSVPGAGVLLESGLAETFDNAIVSPEDRRQGLAAHFAGFMARNARERGLLGGTPGAQPQGGQGQPSPEPQAQGGAGQQISGTQGPEGPGDPVAHALVAAFREAGVEAAFQDANTLVIQLTDGNSASTDISGFRSALDAATPEQIAQHASGFSRSALDQLAQATQDSAAQPAGQLRVRLYPVNAFPEGVMEQLVTREVAPGLWQTVVIDSPDSLQPLPRAAHEQSGRPDGQVFAEAVSGALSEPVEVSEHEYNGAKVMHIGGQHPYVAAHAHALDRYLGESPYGAIVAFPVPEVILAHPLGQGHPVAAMDHMQQVAERFAADAEKPISAQLYWWHPNSRGRGQGEPLDLRAVGVTLDHEAKSVSLHTADEEFGPMLTSLAQRG
ncbi:hypothetical protein [Nocardiopsis oceani]